MSPSQLRQVAAFVLAFTVIAPVFALERPGGFTVVGQGGGGATFHPTISPHDPNTVLVACDMTGAYITRDGGRSGGCSICAEWCAFSPLIR
jgi:hypothetical protein